MKKKLIKLRNYWLNVSYTKARKTGDKELIQACDYLEKIAMKLSENTTLPFDYSLAPPNIKRKWKVFFIEFIIISEK